jgi:hypothetical protein
LATPDTVPRRFRLISEYERIFREIKENNVEGLAGMRKELRSLEVRSPLSLSQCSSLLSSSLLFTQHLQRRLNEGEKPIGDKDLTLRWTRLNDTIDETIENVSEER